MTTTVLAYLPSPAQGVWHLGPFHLLGVQLGPFPLRAYALCILVGIVAALILGDRRWSARGGEPGVIYDIALWAVPFGLIGGRLYHVLTDWTTYFGDTGKGFGAALRIWDGGLGIWGAVALGGVGAWIACRRRGIPLPAFGDAIAPGIILAQAIGRLGNYFNQELYGRPTTLPWGLEVYERRNAAGLPDSLNGVSTGQLVEVVHPTFLYELLWNLLVFALLLVIDRRFKIGHGRLFALYVAGYCLGRFWIELMRSDYATTIADTGIRVNTFTSTFVFIAAVVYIMVATKGREAPETLRGNATDADSGTDSESALENVAEGVVAAAATSGVVAAAVVARGEDDRGEPDDTDEPQTTDLAGPGESEAAAEAEDLAEQVETASSEDIAEAVAFAEAGAESDDQSAPEEGLGSVDGDEVSAAADDAAEVRVAAAEGAQKAEALAEDVADEPEPAPESTPATAEVAVEGTEVGEALNADVEEVSTESESSDEEPTEFVPDDEVAAAEVEAGAPEAFPVAVEGTEVAEALEADVADVAPEEPTDTDESAPEEGLGSVDGDEVEAAEADAADVHEAAVDGADAAEALAEQTVAPTRRRWWQRNRG